MSQIRIELASASAAFEPGESVEGQVVWQLAPGDATLEIRLLWRTAGKGTPDSACIQTIPVDRPTPDGAHPFAFKLPAGPYSFTGQLISLTWTIEAEALPSRTSARHPIVLALGRSGLVLASSV